MATTIAVGDLLEVKLYCSAAEQVSINVLGYRIDTILGGAITLEQLPNLIKPFFDAIYPALLGPTATWLGVGVRRIFPGIATQEHFSTLPHFAGTGTGDLLPRQSAGIMTKRTGLGGPKFRGRVYVAFPSEGMNDPSGTPNAGYVANLALFAIALQAPLGLVIGPNSVTISLVLIHRPTLTYTPVTRVDARAFWGTQRRRGSYGQPNLPPL